MQCRSCGVDKDISEFYIRTDNGKPRSHCRSCHHNDSLTRKYGISLEEYDALYERQEGGCAICGLPQMSKRNTRLCVDHDHETGEVRGLLCDGCNRGIGLLKDDYRLLERAAGYLRATQG